MQDSEYESLKRLMDRSKNLDDFDRRVGGASALQARLFVDYVKLKETQEQELARRIRRTVAILRIRDKFGRIHYRDRRTGRFVRSRSRGRRKSRGKRRGLL